MYTNATDSPQQEMPDFCGPIAEASPIPMAALEGPGHIFGMPTQRFASWPANGGRTHRTRLWHELCRRLMMRVCLCLHRVYRTAQSETHIEEPSARIPSTGRMPCGQFWQPTDVHWELSSR